MDSKKPPVVKTRKSKRHNYNTTLDSIEVDKIQEDNTSLFQFVSRPSNQNENKQKSREPPPVMPRKNMFDSSELNTSYNPFLVRRSISSSNSNLSQSFHDSRSLGSPENEIILRGIFSHEGRTVDLELSSVELKWKFVNSDKSKSKKRSNECTIRLDKVYNIEANVQKKLVKKSNNNEQLNSEILINGFALHMFENEEPNLYKPKSLIFEHPHRETTKEWIYLIKDKLPSKAFKSVKIAVFPD